MTEATGKSTSYSFTWGLFKSLIKVHLVHVQRFLAGYLHKKCWWTGPSKWQLQDVIVWMMDCSLWDTYTHSHEMSSFRDTMSTIHKRFMEHQEQTEYPNRMSCSPDQSFGLCFSCTFFLSMWDRLQSGETDNEWIWWSHELMMNNFRYKICPFEVWEEDSIVMTKWAEAILNIATKWDEQQSIWAPDPEICWKLLTSTIFFFSSGVNYQNSH